MKFKSFFGSLVVSTAVASLVTAQPPQGHEGRPPKNPVLEALDQNHDHELSSEEIENATANLKRLDKNSDGVLNEDDLGHMGPPSGGRPHGGNGHGRPGQENASGNFIGQLLQFDDNKDGELEKGELPARMHGLIEQNDKNYDGVLDQTELEAMEGETETPAETRTRNRTRRKPQGRGGDRTEQFVKHCMSFDANGDGQLSEEELQECAENMPPRGGPGNGQGRPSGGGRPGGRPQ